MATTAGLKEERAVTDFVIVIATAAAAALASPAPDAAPRPVPMNAPIVGFSAYASLDACERAAAAAVAPAGTRLVCLPVEPQLGELASAY